MGWLARRDLLSVWLVLVVCWSSGHGSEELDKSARTFNGFEASAEQKDRALRESGIEERVEQENRARKLMEESERDDELIQQEAQRYRHRQEERPDRGAEGQHKPALELGESAQWDHAPQPGPEAARIMEAMQESRSSPKNNLPFHHSADGPDLGESAGMGGAAEVNNANALTARAQLKARQKAAEKVRQNQILTAKQIAAKVKKLVSVQKHLEQQARVPYSGMVDQGESIRANQKIAEVAKSHIHDALLAQRMEASTARATFKHLMEHEREEQHQALEAERKHSHDVLEAVKKSLQTKQQEIVSQLQAFEKNVEGKMQKKLAQSSIATAIGDAIKKKLSKRVDALTTAGQQVVGGVTDSVSSLKRRVHRLRRSQDRIRSEQSVIQRTLSTQKTAEQQYLGESSRTAHLEHELESMRQQQKVPVEQGPTNLELQNELLKEKLHNAELQNQLLRQKSTMPSDTSGAYSPSGMRHYFSQKRRKDELAKQVRDEEQNLKMLKLNLEEADHNSRSLKSRSLPRAQTKAQLQADVFLQIENDAQIGGAAAPVYQLHKKQADEEIKQMLALAQNNKL